MEMARAGCSDEDSSSEPLLVFDVVVGMDEEDVLSVSEVSEEEELIPINRSQKAPQGVSIGMVSFEWDCESTNRL
jgi:hypothetical protein